MKLSEMVTNLGAILIVFTTKVYCWKLLLRVALRIDNKLFEWNTFNLHFNRDERNISSLESFIFSRYCRQWHVDITNVLWENKCYVCLYCKKALSLDYEMHIYIFQTSRYNIHISMDICIQLDIWTLESASNAKV